MSFSMQIYSSSSLSYVFISVPDMLQILFQSSFQSHLHLLVFQTVNEGIQHGSDAVYCTEKISSAGDPEFGMRWRSKPEPKYSVTAVRWEEQVEKGLLLPEVELILRMAVIMWA